MTQITQMKASKPLAHERRELSEHDMDEGVT